MTRKELALDGDKPLWTIPASRTKNGIAHAVPLSRAALEIIEALPKIGKAGFCFTTTGETHVTGFSRSKGRLDAAMLDIMHDDDPESDSCRTGPFTTLRRTMASGMAG